MFRMPRTKKPSKKSNLDTANIEIDPNKSIINDMKSVEDVMDLKDKEILGDLEVEKPEVRKLLSYMV